MIVNTFRVAEGAVLWASSVMSNWKEKLFLDQIEDMLETEPFLYVPLPYSHWLPLTLQDKSTHRKNQTKVFPLISIYQNKIEAE